MGLTAKQQLEKYLNDLISEKELTCPTCNSNSFYGALVIDTHRFNFKIKKDKIEDLNLFELYEDNSYIEIKCNNKKCEGKRVLIDSYDF